MQKFKCQLAPGCPAGDGKYTSSAVIETAITFSKQHERIPSHRTRPIFKQFTLLWMFMPAPESKEIYVQMRSRQSKWMTVQLEASIRVFSEMFQSIKLRERKLAILEKDLWRSQLDLEFQGAAGKTSSTQETEHLDLRKRGTRGQQKRLVKPKMRSKDYSLPILVYFMSPSEEASRHCHEYTAAFPQSTSKSITCSTP